MTELSLSQTAVTGRGFESFIEQSSLQSIDLSESAVSDSGLSFVARLPNLKKLELRKTKITAAGLSELRHAKNLTDLDLCDTQINDSDLEIISRIPNLRYLTIGKDQLSKASLIRFYEQHPDWIFYQNED